MAAVLFTQAMHGAAVDGDLAFNVYTVSTDDASREPTLSYAPNGTLWYSGANSGTDGFLWWANTDTSAFVKEADPPTRGSTDAVVHHDLDGRLFWGEMNRSLDQGGCTQGSACNYTGEIAVRQNGVWYQQNFTSVDRPWFRTNTSGVTFLAFTNWSNPQTLRIEVWTNRSGVQGWSAFSAGSNNVSYPSELADFVNHTDGTLYLLFINDLTEQFKVAYRGPNDASWQFTPEFVINKPREFGLMRVAVDLAKNLYVVYGDQIGSDYSIWLRHYDGAAWSAATRLGVANNTTALPSVATGSGGRIGVAWYEANGSFFPRNADANTTWRFVYSVFQNANSTPALVQRAVVVNNTHSGTLDPKATFGDFTYAVRRQSDSVGRAALAFSCDALDAQLRCIGHPDGGQPPFPAYAVQTDGPGLL